MIIIFGIDHLDLTDPAQQSCKCQACGRDALFSTFKAAWVQFCFLPVIPLGYVSAVQCLSCKSEYRKGDLDEESRAWYKQQRNRARKRGGFAVTLGFAFVLTIVACFITSIATAKP